MLFTGLSKPNTSKWKPTKGFSECFDTTKSFERKLELRFTYRTYGIYDGLIQQNDHFQVGIMFTVLSKTITSKRKRTKGVSDK